MSLDATRPPGARVPLAAATGAPTGDAVELYHRTYTTLLRSTGEMRLRVFEASHRAMGSSLHPLAASPEPDLGAFIYANRRLPESIVAARLVVMGQSAEVFARNGFDLDSDGAEPSWAQVEAAGRRRRWYVDDSGTLAVLVASASDVDDLIPTLVAWQIEWNKMHVRLADSEVPEGPVEAEWCALQLGGRIEDWLQLQALWGARFAELVAAIRERAVSLRVRMLGGTQVGYARVTRRWWQPVLDLLAAEELDDRPVYFVSSNSHSTVNLVNGMAAQREAELTEFVERSGPTELRRELHRFREGTNQGDWANFLYYAARLYYRSLPAEDPLHEERRAVERRIGIFHVGSSGALDIAVQVIVLDRLDPARLDPRLHPVSAGLGRSGAVVINVDYPLGQAAYTILTEIAETVGTLRGVYVLGKAATLNADVGDVMISNVVHDEHSACTFWLDNAFSVADIAPYLRFGSGLDNQRAVTVRGTFLQNRDHLDFYYREMFTVVEMEAGPYCTAVYELSEMGRHPTAEPVNFSKLPVDFGLIHYASDTPFTQARTLGARGLSYQGMDSTYASSVAILRRILHLEAAFDAVPPQPPRPEAHLHPASA